jgi:hypothetical protein
MGALPAPEATQSGSPPPRPKHRSFFRGMIWLSGSGRQAQEPARRWSQICRARPGVGSKWPLGELSSCRRTCFTCVNGWSAGAAMEKRYQVFISSTFVDLLDTRQEILRALLQSDYIPAGMEFFPAVDEEQFEFIKKTIDQSDYLIIIVAGRYGSINRITKLSYTEMEFDYANKNNIPTIALLHQNWEHLPNDQCEPTKEGRAALKRFTNKLRNEKLVRFWEDPKELVHNVIISLNRAKESNPMRGWARLPKIQPPPPPPGTADKFHGAYTRDHCQGYLGYFYAYRRTFGAPQDFDRSLFEFSWSEERSCLIFTDTQTFPSSKGLEVRVHKGEVFFNSAAPLVHLLIADRAALRLLTLTRLEMVGATMNGIILSQFKNGEFYHPAIAPITLQRQDRSATREQLMKGIGLIRPQSPDYALAARYLIDIERNFGRFALASRIPSAEEERADQAPPVSIGETDQESRPPLKH